MRLATCSNFCLSLILLLVFPFTALAIPAITCHCYTDRSYDPARPTLADPYFLATAQNSFFSAVFATDKSGIIMKKQSGTSSDDLWVAYWLASKGGTASPDAILHSRLGKKSWQDVVATMGLSDRKLGARFAASLKVYSSTARLAETVVDGLLLQYQLLGETELAALRKAGGTNQELILATLIAFKTRQSATQLYLEVKSSSKSWGTLLERAKIKPMEIQKEIILLIGRPRQT